MWKNSRLKKVKGLGDSTSANTPCLQRKMLPQSKKLGSSADLIVRFDEHTYLMNSSQNPGNVGYISGLPFIGKDKK
jgi:hypothetical protein